MPEIPAPRRQGNLEFLRIVTSILPEEIIDDSERAYGYLEEIVHHKRQAEQNVLGSNFYEQLFFALKQNQNLSETLLTLGFEASEEDAAQLLKALAHWLTAPVAALQSVAENCTEVAVEKPELLNSRLWPASVLNSWSGALQEGSPDVTWIIEDDNTVVCQGRRLSLNGRECHAINLLLLLHNYGSINYRELQQLGFMPEARNAREMGTFLAQLTARVNKFAGKEVLTRSAIKRKWAYRIEATIILQELNRDNLPSNHLNAVRVFGQHVLDLTHRIRRMSLQRHVRPPASVPQQSGPAEFDVEADIEALTALPETARDQNWQNEARCAYDNPQLHWPENKAAQEAKQVCGGCPVRIECLDFALANDEKEGVWGGYVGRARSRIKKRLPVRYN